MDLSRFDPQAGHFMAFLHTKCELQAPWAGGNVANLVLSDRLLARLVSEDTRQRDVFGKLRLAEGIYTSGDIDVSAWAKHIEADYTEWLPTQS